MSDLFNMISTWWVELMLFLLLATASIDLIYLVLRMKPVPRRKSISGLFYLIILFTFVHTGYLQGDSITFSTDKAIEEILTDRHTAGACSGNTAGCIKYNHCNRFGKS